MKTWQGSILGIQHQPDQEIRILVHTMIGELINHYSLIRFAYNTYLYCTYKLNLVLIFIARLLSRLLQILSTPSSNFASFLQ